MSKENYKARLYYVSKFIKDKLYVFIYNFKKILFLVIICLSATFVLKHAAYGFQLSEDSNSVETTARMQYKPKTEFVTNSHDPINDIITCETGYAPQVFKNPEILQKNINYELISSPKKPIFPKRLESFPQKINKKNCNFTFSELQKIVLFSNLFIAYLKLNTCNNNINKQADFKNKKKNEIELLIDFDCLNLKVGQRVITTVNYPFYKLEVGSVGVISKVITCHTAKTIFSQEKPQISKKKKIELSQNYFSFIFCKN